jgi:fluoroacetyl-CoA thioesterase
VKQKKLAGGVNDMSKQLEVGLKHSAEMVVTEGMTVPGNADKLPTFADMPDVLATAFFIAFIEATCLDLVRPFLKADEHTVGTLVGVTHTAATPVGMKVKAEVELIEVDGRRLCFKVKCFDEVEAIGGGLHERFIIHMGKFMAKVEGKADLS